MAECVVDEDGEDAEYVALLRRVIEEVLRYLHHDHDNSNGSTSEEEEEEEQQENRAAVEEKIARIVQRLRTRSVEEQRMYLADVLTVSLADFTPEIVEHIHALLDREAQQRTVTAWETLPRLSDQPELLGNKIAIWRGDITTLRVEAIVNAANSAMLGCFQPQHLCIDNVIHARAGPLLRSECHRIMQAQGAPEPTGHAKLTAGYKLPAKYVIHTVGPIFYESRVERPDELASCYTSVLDLCRERRIRTVAFCGISTGVFGYPAEPAAIVACRTVKRWLLEERRNRDAMDLIVFNVFSETAEGIYRKHAPSYFCQ